MRKITPLLYACLLGLFLSGPTPASDKDTSPDFERQVQGVLGKTGCNSGSCHGSFQGKAGFYLSLFGYHSEKDYLSLTRDAQGRRINTNDPDQSLMLLKATGKLSHGGGVRFSKDSESYKIIKDWIAAGAPWNKGSGDVERMEIVPSHHKFNAPEESLQLKVLAHFKDGSSTDVTKLTEFRTNDDFIAAVDQQGKITASRPGDTSIVISYRGNVTAMRTLVPRKVEAGFSFPKLSSTNYIDDHIYTKLKELNIVPSAKNSDHEFLRRLYLDVTGSLPKPAEVEAFLKDTSPDKREKLIDELLKHPLHAALWATKFSDVTGNSVDSMLDPNNQPLRARRAQMWHDWLRKRFAENTPYHEMVHGILCSTSRDKLAVEDWIKQIDALDQAAEKSFFSDYAKRDSLDLYWRKSNFTLELMGEQVATAFLGVRIECAQCHKHPFDRWTQTDYRSFANIFAQVNVGLSKDTKSPADKINQERKDKEEDARKKNQVVQIREVFLTMDPPDSERNVRPGAKNPRRNLAKQPLKHPETNEELQPKALGGTTIDYNGDSREDLYTWLTEKNNPFFAKALVNRVWAHYLGVGFVEPVDNFSVGNPASHPELLEALAKDFIDSNYDFRKLERTILLSMAYQRSAEANETNQQDKNNFARAYPRRVLAETVADMLNDALGYLEVYQDGPAGARAIEIATNRVTGNLGYLFRIFGRSPRTMSCECERTVDPALPQTLFLMTDQLVMNKITQGRLKKLLAAKTSDEDILKELFLASLTRYPTEAEKEKSLAFVKNRKDKPAAWADVAWAIINTREFILNH